MRVITIARKPFKGSTTRNVVEYEAGALNIDAARIGDKKRWPPNVMLTHRDGCKIVGERKVPTGTAHRENSGGRTIFSETEKKTMPNMTYADEDGMGTIPDWECEPECPVASLDRQSGELTSGTGAVKRSSSKDQGGNRASAYGAESRPEGTPVVTYGDTGGASRFFRQFGGDQSE